jgi:flavin-dependent dehydrogenase
VEDVRLQYGDHTIHARGRPQFVVFHRPELDAYLAEQARVRGVQIRENEAVISFNIDGEGVTVNTGDSTYRARAMVGADGSKGIVRRTLMRGEKRPRVARLLETVRPSDPASPLFTEKYARFDFTPLEDGLQGYCWDFPSTVSGRLSSNLGIYDARVDEGRRQAHLPELLDRFLTSTSVQGGARIDGHPIHWFSPRSRFAWPRLLLVGDAAGADSLFGEGIAPALGYGQVAAQAVQDAFGTGDFSFADYRRRILTSPVGRYLMLRWWAAEGIYRQSENRLFMRLVWVMGDILARLWPKSSELGNFRN